MDNVHPQNVGTQLISQFPQISHDIKLSDIQSNLTFLPILWEPAVTYEFYLPSIDHVFPIKFYNNNTYRPPYMKHIHASSPVGKQLQEAALKQQWILGIDTIFQQPMMNSYESQLPAPIRRSQSSWRPESLTIINIMNRNVQSLTRCPVFFSNSSFSIISHNRRSIQSNCGLFNSVLISWKPNI